MVATCVQVYGWVRAAASNRRVLEWWGRWSQSFFLCVGWRRCQLVLTHHRTPAFLSRSFSIAAWSYIRFCIEPSAMLSCQANRLFWRARQLLALSAHVRKQVGSGRALLVSQFWCSQLSLVFNAVRAQMLRGSYGLGGGVCLCESWRPTGCSANQCIAASSCMIGAIFVFVLAL